MAKNIENEMENEEKNEYLIGEENQAENFIQKNSKIIITASIVIILIVGLLVVFRNKSKEDETIASTLLTRVLPYYESADYKKSLDGDPEKTYLGEPVKGLKFIVEEYESTPAGRLAALYTGNILLSTSKYAEAKEYFEIAQDASSKYVQAGALAGLAGCLETENKFVEAAKMYEDAANLILDDEVSARYRYYAGFAYEKAGNKEKSEKIYRDIINRSKFSEFSQMAKAGLIRIGTIIE